MQLGELLRYTFLILSSVDAVLRDHTVPLFVRFPLPNRFKVVPHITSSTRTRRTRTGGTVPEELIHEGEPEHQNRVTACSFTFYKVAEPAPTQSSAAITEEHFSSVDNRLMPFGSNNPPVAISTFPDDRDTRNLGRAQSLNTTAILHSLDGAETGQDAPLSRFRAPSDLPVDSVHCQVVSGSDAQAPRNISRATASTSTHPTSSGTPTVDNLLSSSSSSQQSDLNLRARQPSGSSHHSSIAGANINIPDAETTGEEVPEVEEAVPGKGPTTGGLQVVIFGHAFPRPPLYVRFGGAITRAVSNGLLQPCQYLS